MVRLSSERRFHIRGVGASLALATILAVVAVGDTVEDQARGTEPDRATLFAERFADGVITDWEIKQGIPIWKRYQDLPVVYFDNSLTKQSSVTDSCPSMLQINFGFNYLATHLDYENQGTAIYTINTPNTTVLKYDVLTDLSYSSTPIDLDSAYPRIAQDLDLDGNIEIVAQWGDAIRIYSAPSWTLRAEFVWPGMNVQMKPAAANIDDDDFLEIFVTPSFLFGSGRIVVIDYDTASGTFVKSVDIPAPNGAAGRPAIGDFDNDGRVEIVSGTNIGYDLYEWQESTLVYIGMVGDTLFFGSFNAVACRPKPGGLLHALIGQSAPSIGYKYQLLEPTGDNTFVVTEVFESSNGMGIHPCSAIDTDCDGLDELAMVHPPIAGIWEWDIAADSFVQSCSWDFETYGTIIDWYPVDLNQDGIPEWGSLNHLWNFRAFPANECESCDSTGRCLLTGPWCYCPCAGDPQCDSILDVFDVLAAVDVAFQNGAPIYNQSCPRDDTDVTCDSVTDVFDILAIVLVAFQNGDPQQAFCSPCSN